MTHAAGRSYAWRVDSARATAPAAQNIRLAKLHIDTGIVRYVQSFPTLTGKWPISTDGGTQPRWGHDGKELFYLALDQKLTAVTVMAAATFEADTPRALFKTTLPVSAFRQEYSVRPDGQRFLLNTPLETTTSPMTVVLNWPALLLKK